MRLPLSAIALAAVLGEMRNHPASGVFMRALPTGGSPGSTLRSRLRGVPVRAKTGSLLAVRCLAGYVEGPRGEPLIFVIMANHYTTSGGRIGQAADRIVRALADGKQEVRATAADWLAELGDPAAIEALKQADRQSAS